MSAYTKALTRSRAISTQAHDEAIQLKAAGMLASQIQPMASLNPFSDNRRSMTQYGLFRGWLYAAVNALASEGAGQPVHLGRMKSKGTKPKGRPSRTKSYLMSRMGSSASSKAARRELEVIEDHDLYKSLERPNPIQDRWQFTYSFIANLCLTGWSYIVAGDSKEGMEFWSLPTTWIKPLHEKGPFSEFKIVNPNKPESAQEAKTYGRDQVAFAHLPNPSDPLSAMSPATAQLSSIRVDDHIMTSQELFFENGIFPSAIVVVGKNPHPDVPGGVRPRLTAAQRRQVYGVIQKVMGGVANYGNPAIVDGLIEKIERLTMSSNEMGWDKSEDKVRTRILSAYGVHPYILGEAVSVGGYAQVANIERRFFKKVNTYLDMMSNVMSNFTSRMEGEELLVWWEKCEAQDPQMHWANMRAARSSGDVTQNEIREMLGLAPDEDSNESIIAANITQHLLKLLGMLAEGGVTEKQAQATMEGWGLPTKLAKELSKPPEKKEPPPMIPGQQPGVPGQEVVSGEPVKPGEEEKPVKPGAKPPKPGAKPKPESLEESSKRLRDAIASMRVSPSEIAGYITSEVEQG